MKSDITNWCTKLRLHIPKIGCDYNNFRQFNIENDFPLTAETSKGRMKTIRNEKYQAMKTAMVTSQCCFRQFPYW